MLASHGALVRFLGETDLIEPRQAREIARATGPREGERVLRAARALREAIARIVYGYVDGEEPPESAIRLLERQANAAQRHKELTWIRPGGQSALEWQWGRFATHADIPVWQMADAATTLLTSDAMRRVKACEAGNCRWLFLDTSKNGARRWCKMEVCGNRMKARRFQQRLSHAS